MDDAHCGPRDSVDALLASWAQVSPDLDVAPVGVVARLARVRAHIDGELDRVFAEHSVSAPTFGVLVTLTRLGGGDGVSQRRLADELGLTSGTISVRIDRLVDGGLAERRADPESARNVRVVLTPRGRELFDRVVPAHLANERRLLSALSARDQDELAALLRKLLVEFEGSSPPPGAGLGLGADLWPVHVTIALREAVGLAPVAGLMVRSVLEGGPAEHAGLRTGDVLVRAGRRELRSVAALHAAVADVAKSRRLRLRLVRGADERAVTVALARAARTAAVRGAHGV
jgi:DNA-binding MarR family transcriptional regulator